VPDGAHAPAPADEADPAARPPVASRRRARFDRAILDSLPFLAWLKDVDSRYVAVNRWFAQAGGHASPDDLVGKTDFDLTTPALAERYRADDRWVMAARTPKVVDEPIWLSGREIWFETFKAPVEDEDGTLLGTVGFARDIDERKRTERLLEVQRDLGVALAEAEESGAAYSALLRFALDVPGVQAAGVYESREDGAFVLRVHEGLSEAFVSRIAVVPPDLPEMQVVLRGRRICSWRDFGPSFTALLQRERLRAAVVIPIRRAGQVAGCLNLASDVSDRIGEDAVLSLETMCLHFGHVLDRLGTQEALRESEARWGFALEGAGDGVWDWHVPSGRVFYSRRWKEMLGYDEHEIGDTYEEWSSRVHPDDRPQVEIEPGRHFRGELPHFATEHRLRRKDGTYMWVLDRGRVVERDADGNAVRVIGIQTDISERKRAEAALRDSEQFLRDVITSTSDGILVEDGRGRVLIASQRFAQMWRIPRDLLASNDELAMRAFVLDQLEDPEAFDQRVRELSGTDVDSSDTLVFKDGRFFERYSSALIRDGKIAGRVWSFRDVTATRRSETLFRSVIASTPDAFVAFDADLTILDWSAQAEQLFGWTAAEILGQPAAGKLWPTEVAATLVAGLSRFIRSGRSNVVGRVRRESAMRRDGSEFPAELQLGASRIGGQWRFSAFVRDITERVLADERLAQAEKLEAIGQLTGGLAHDFNNVLGIVIGNLDLVAGAESDRERAELVAAARDAAARGAEVTRALLSIARRQQLSPRNADVNSLLRELAPLLRHTAGKRVTLSIEAGEEPGLSHVDQGGFNNALLNLVINARDAMPAGGEIRVRTDVVTLGSDAPAPLAEGQFVLVEVSDTGIGMPPEVAARAFDPFFTTKGRGKGTGLGLAMVYGFARQSGGTAVIHSAVGRGTTVQVYLPAASEEPASEVTAGSPRETGTVGGHERVLLVDDEPALVEVGRRWLVALGYDATAVTNPAAAVRLLSTEPFDALVSDVVMPGEMDGVGLATEAARLQPGICILLVSGYPEGLGEKIQGRWPLLDKPYTRDQLAAMLRRALGRRPAGSEEPPPAP
jgi:PAS domain S-box-containing protein